MDEEKNGYILAECFWLLIEGSLWGYFAYVTYTFEDTWLPKEEEEAEPNKDEENKDAEKNKKE